MNHEMFIIMLRINGHNDDLVGITTESKEEKYKRGGIRYGKTDFQHYWNDVHGMREGHREKRQ
jgi:hypothetical protein